MVRRISILVMAALIAGSTAAGGDARPQHREQDAAFEGTQQGKLMPLRSIEARVIPQVPGASYLGPEFDSGSGRYRLKFLRRDRVIWVDVDGRTGQILARTGD